MFEILNLRARLERAWSAESSYGKGWSPSNPSWGQCTITSMIVNEMFGGKILRVKYGRGWHYYNEIEVLGQPTIVDLTRDQFENYSGDAETVERKLKDLLKISSVKERYDLLKAALENV